MDLAGQLGVSRGTVRVALQQLEAQGLVKELPGRGRKARGRIVSPAAKVGRGGLMGRTIVLVTHGTGALSDNPNLYAAGKAELAVDSGVIQALHALNMHVLCINAASFTDAEANDLIGSSPSGIIVGRPAIQFPHVQPLLQRIVESGLPLVATGHDAGGIAGDRIISDHDAGGYMLTRWLIDRGCRKIVQPGWVRDRIAGHTRAMHEAGLSPLQRIHATNVDPCSMIEVTTPSSQRRELNQGQSHFEKRVRQVAGFVAAAVLGADPVDAIMADNDWDASIILGACRLLGLEPNKKVIVVGYDDWWDSEEREWEPSVPAATIDKRNAEVGREAVRLMMQRVEGNLPPEPQVWRVTPRLVEIDASVAMSAD
jgi:DNA-binding LacI/PurR family transcriptional regulator